MTLEVLKPEIVDAIRKRDVNRMMRDVTSSCGRVMTPGEVASFFRVDAKTVTRWALAGLIPHFKTPGGHVRLWEHDVLDALQTTHVVDDPLFDFTRWLISLDDVDQADERRAITLTDIIDRARYAINQRRVTLQLRINDVLKES